MHDWQATKTVIGMLHLAALPGSPRFNGDLPAIRQRLVQDADALVNGGVHALMIENFGDVPFYPAQVPPHIVAHMTSLACDIRRRFAQVPLGINVLRNDARSALAVAQAAGAEFIRVNVLCGARVADQGILHGVAHDLLRDRAMLRADRIRIFADVDVKHSAPLANRPIADEVDDTIVRGLADALIVSGAGTGKATELGKVKSVKASAGRIPVFVGSGITTESIGNYLPYVDGFIVGSAFKEDGIASQPVEIERVHSLMRRVI